ncbi:MAG: iron-sulfur cluster assembly accessory protein [Gammaproteobacteria bacterium]|jgi:iron-sulfur cluster assembly protein|nr:iron-sulfur cluster assembly accessory protein [Gammaproteobacteria bacterium]
MAIELTESAARHVQGFLASRGGEAGLRLGVKRSGCSGWSYVIDFAEAATSADAVFESHGVRIIVDRESLSLIDGTEVDYEKDGLNQAFRFRNPNVQDECGCGESFNVS